MASVGSTIDGSGTVSTRTSRFPFQTAAFISLLLGDRTARCSTDPRPVPRRRPHHSVGRARRRPTASASERLSRSLPLHLAVVGGEPALVVEPPTAGDLCHRPVLAG